MEGCGVCAALEGPGGEELARALVERAWPADRPPDWTAEKFDKLLGPGDPFADRMARAAGLWYDRQLVNEHVFELASGDASRPRRLAGGGWNIVPRHVQRVERP